jgi:PhnB protein
MGSDSHPRYGDVGFGDNFSISINTESTDEADRIFNGLSAGGKVEMPLNKTFWGAYFGMFKDKFGVNWMVNFDENEPQQ